MIIGSTGYTLLPGSCLVLFYKVQCQGEEFALENYVAYLLKIKNMFKEIKQNKKFSFY